MPARHHDAATKHLHTFSMRGTESLVVCVLRLLFVFTVICNCDHHETNNIVNVTHRASNRGMGMEYKQQTYVKLHEKKKKTRMLYTNSIFLILCIIYLYLLRLWDLFDDSRKSHTPHARWVAVTQQHTHASRCRSIMFWTTLRMLGYTEGFSSPVTYNSSLYLPFINPFKTQFMLFII